MRILIADAFPDPHRQTLGDQGHTVRYVPNTTSDSLGEEIEDTDVLIVRSTRVDAGAIDAGKHLRLIVRAGAGTNTIDVQAAAGPCRLRLQRAWS